jgi:hypothetical protein
MPIPVRVVYVLIASPGDLQEERDVVERAVHDWNQRRTEQSGLVLLPLRWETGSVAISGQGDAQSVINAQLVAKADIVFALFYSKLGSATARAISGTAEEIERSVESGKPVHIYFSTQNLPHSVDDRQLRALRSFRERVRRHGLVGEFGSHSDLSTIVQSAIEYDIRKLRAPDDLSNSSSPEKHWTLVDTFVDTALFLHDEHNGRKEISERLQRASSSETDRDGAPLIPSRYHYSTEAAAELWLSRSSDRGPRSNQRRTNEFWAGSGGKQFTDFVLEYISPDSVLDFISLGPGDGTKDAYIASRWIEAGIDLTYYPYDASPKLAAVAVNRVTAHTRASKNAELLRKRLVIADFRDIEQVHQVFMDRPARNLISLLGNLGNLDNDLGFLRDLQHIMSEDDLLLLEVRLRSAATLEDLTPEASLRHDFGPLEYYLAMDWSRYRSGVQAHFSETRSEIEGTETLVTTYTGSVPEFVEEQFAALQYIHFYNPSEFIRKVTEIGFEVLLQVLGGPGEESTFLECLLRREPVR